MASIDSLQGSRKKNFNIKVGFVPMLHLSVGTELANFSFKDQSYKI